MQKEKKYNYKLGYISVVFLILALLGSYGTYAWYTQNKQANAEQVTVRSGTEDMQIKVSKSEQGPFQAVVDITQEEREILQPVSTVDLQHFYKPNRVTEQAATLFAETEEGYYEQEIYLRTQVEGSKPKDSMRLYIDTDGITIKEDDSAVTKAARVGLVFSYNGIEMDPIILCFEAEPDGTKVVQRIENGKPIEVKDPCILADKVTLQENNTQLILPEQCLVELPPNVTCKVRVVCYLEGSDVDCQSTIENKPFTIQLPFYGMLNEGGN